MTIQPPQTSTPSVHHSAVDPIPPETRVVPSLASSSYFSTPQPGLKQWFYNLPVRRKQLTALLVSELIAVVGLVGVASWLIVSSGRNQLVLQAKSEVAVTGLQYNTKINQMGSAFRGQSENPAMIQVAREATGGRQPTPGLREQISAILASEARAQEIEYATLVGTDLRIIANANANRAGEKFDPEGLVGTVLTNPRQVKTSAIVSAGELANEKPPLPQGFANQDALIRYVVTPVQDPDTNAVIGVLVAGDIVNNKLPIVKDTLATFGSGYSAIYQRQPNGEFTLATSMNAGDTSDLNQAAVNVALPNSTLLDQAVALRGQPVTRRVTIEGQTYTMAAQAVLNFKNEPVAILVRGTSETSLNALLRRTLLAQLVIAALALAADIALAGALSRTIAYPIEQLRRVAQRYAQGDRQARAEVLALDEVGELALTLNELANSVSRSEAILNEQARRQQQALERANLLTEVTLQIRRSLDESEILSVSVDGVRQLLNVDRVLIYRFNSDFKSGVITAESVGEGWRKAMGQPISDPLTPALLERFRSGKISAIENRSEANLTQCHCELLEQLEVQANIIAPILVGNRLTGLLCAHQCSGPRVWDPSEVELMQQLSVQIGYALAQANLLQQQHNASKREHQLNLIGAQMQKMTHQDQLFNLVVREVCRALAADRVIVYTFDSEWAGTIVAEHVEPGWVPALNAKIKDPCFAEQFVERYRQGYIRATENIYDAGLTECHLNQLSPFQVKANLVAPIVVKDELIGLLIAHQCSGPRAWQESDLSFMRQVTIQFGFALEQVRLIAQQEEARLAAEALTEEQRRQKESLQLQLIDLLSEVEGAARGDLTVRADVTAGDIGTVADFFNSIIESLRQIVTQVKQSATQVNSALGENEDAVRRLADEALKQAEEITQTLDSVEHMTQSIQVVAQNAQQAAEVARLASTTAASGGTAMELTVHNIIALRETIGETAKKVKRLGESSQQISKVVSLINQIALQTNLLAINAGIEAARAGEEGQGFAVVAEEVGELAARSASATQEIEKIVAAIQRETSQVVEAMEQSTAQVVEGTHLVEEAKQSLGQILSVSRQIDSLVQSISEATVSQVETSAAVSRLMRQIAETSERTSDSSRQVSQAIRQTVAVAQELQASVGAFKVSPDPS